MQSLSLILRASREEVIKNVLCVADESDIDFSAVSFLSDYEREKYAMLKNSGAKKRFLLGRYCAKSALIQLSGQNQNLRDIEIKNGIWGHPVIYSPQYDVSISHTKAEKCLGAAVAFDRSFPIGIDIEAINPAKIETLKRANPELEQSGIETLTIAWCFKEALSKALKVGLTVPFEWLAITQIKATTQGFACKFGNFNKYSGYATKIDNNILAIVYPTTIT